MEILLINRNEEKVQIGGYTFSINPFADGIDSKNCSIFEYNGVWGFETRYDDPVELDEAVAIVKALQGLTEGTIKFSE